MQLGDQPPPQRRLTTRIRRIRPPSPSSHSPCSICLLLRFLLYRGRQHTHPCTCDALLPRTRTHTHVDLRTHDLLHLVRCLCLGLGYAALEDLHQYHQHNHYNQQDRWQETVRDLDVYRDRHRVRHQAHCKVEARHGYGCRCGCGCGCGYEGEGECECEAEGEKGSSTSASASAKRLVATLCTCLGYVAVHTTHTVAQQDTEERHTECDTERANGTGHGTENQEEEEDQRKDQDRDRDRTDLESKDTADRKEVLVSPLYRLLYTPA